MIDEGQTVQPALRRTQRIAAVAAGVGVVLAVVGFVVNPTQFVQSYLVAFLYCFGLSLGCLAFLMIHYLAGGRWGPRSATSCARRRRFSGSSRSCSSRSSLPFPSSIPGRI